MKKWHPFIFLLFSILLCFGCSRAHHSADNEIKIGTIAGPESELMEVAKNVAKKDYDLNIEIIPFTDYVLPNQALADGSIDANMFQHLPYLEAMITAKGYPLISIGKTFIYPMGIYSTKIKNLNELHPNATVAIPNDPSNGTRALLLLEKAGLLTLNKTDSLKITPQDLLQNPKHINIKELDAAQLPRMIQDVDLAVINTNYAMLAGLMPTRDALFIEDKNSPYANIVVIRAADKNDPKFIKLMNALHSKAVRVKAEQLFHGEAIPAW